MKYTTAAATVLPLALAAELSSRQLTDITFELSDFKASCEDYNGYGGYDYYCTPDFGIGCDVSGSSTDGTLPAVPEMGCGTYKVTVETKNGGGLYLTVYLRMDEVIGTHVIDASDLATTEEADGSGKSLQSYVGETSFTIDTYVSGSGSTTLPSSMETATATTASTASASGATTQVLTTSSAASAETSGSATTGTTTSSAASSTETSGALHEGVWTGALLLCGLIGFAL
ncbi:hypothetical protein G7054_g7333 [Neopestalotiopsis clavispora]|nr:hypothetical protein G7054_g7333 [Neopestalotiopsis clavispora]